MIERRHDEESGIILVSGSGVWSYADIEQHYEALREMIAAIRAEGRPVRVLSDVSQGERQAPWVEDYILEQMAQTFRQGDRIALLAGSENDKAHMRALPNVVAIASFTSRPAAQHWLLAPQAEAGAA